MYQKEVIITLWVFSENLENENKRDKQIFQRSFHCTAARLLVPRISNGLSFILQNQI